MVGWIETPLVIIKSTVSPGTTDLLACTFHKPLIFSPEYCGESSYWSPYQFHQSVVETPFFIFGGPKLLTSRAVDIYMKIGGPTKRYVQTTATEAELAKYMENCFYATKITFCYEMAKICRAFGVDYNEVRELWLNDPRINPMHTAVFSDNDRPFSGKCLPKDLSSLIHDAEMGGVNPGLLRAVQHENQSWERMEAR